MAKYVYQLNKVQLDAFDWKTRLYTVGIFSTEVKAEKFARDYDDADLAFNTPDIRPRNHKTQTQWIHGKESRYPYKYTIEQFQVNPRSAP